MKVSNVYCSPEDFGGKVSYIFILGRPFYLEDLLGTGNARLFIRGPGFFELSFKPIKPKVRCMLAWGSYSVISRLGIGNNLDYLMFSSPGKYFLMFSDSDELRSPIFHNNTWYEKIYLPEDSKINLSTLLYKSNYLKNDFPKLFFINSVLNQVDTGNNDFVMYNNLIKSRSHWIESHSHWVEEVKRYTISTIFN